MDAITIQAVQDAVLAITLGLLAGWIAAAPMCRRH